MTEAVSAGGTGLLPEGRHADLAGVRLWYLDSGGSGTPLVLLHPNTGTSEVWEKQFGAFAGAGHRVIAFDRRGWGRSVAAEGAGVGTIADDLDALADDLGLGRFHLLGVAGGGFAALDYAAWRTERVLSLTVGASYGQFTDPLIADMFSRLSTPDFQRVPAVLREVGPTFRAEDPEGVERWMAIERGSRRPGAPAQPMRSPNTFAKIAGIRCPALVIAAGADLYAPPALMSAWAAHLPAHEWDVVPDAGHAITWERPGPFNARVLDFLRRADAAG